MTDCSTQIWATLERARQLFPRQPALIDGSRRLDYTQLYSRITSLAASLRDRGVQPGDRIAVCEHNSLEFYELYYAAAGIGAVLHPLNVRLTPAELIPILRDAGSHWLFARRGLTHAEVAEATENVVWIDEADYRRATGTPPREFPPTAVEPDDVAHLYYTSGTTGEPKGVMLTHGNVCSHALTAADELGLTSEDVWGHFAPMFHLADAWATFAITHGGGCHVMGGPFDAGRALGAIARDAVTITNLVPTMLTSMLAELESRQQDTASLRLLLSGGAPIAPDVVGRVMAAFGCDYAQTYGMTETSPYLTLSLLHPHLRSLPPEQQLAYKCKTGRPFAAVDLEVVDESGAAVAPDERQVGEIRVRGSTVTPGYWGRPDATAEAIRDGWLYTGDLAVLDTEGYVTIVDRKKDVIITGGENVHSIEVENVLYQHAAVQEAAVFGVPDATWGESVRAAVALRERTTATADELIAFCRGKVAPFKVPRKIEFLDALPRTGSGKISKRALRDRAR